MGPYIYNTGAQVIVGAEGAASVLADELGITRTRIRQTLVPIYMEGRLIRARSESSFLWKLPLPVIEKFRLGWRVLTIRQRFGDLGGRAIDPGDPRFRELSNQTLAGFVGAFHPGVKAMWDTLAIASTMVPSEEVAALEAIDAFLQVRLDEEFAVDGGTGQLARRLWERVADHTRTEAMVEHVCHDGQGVRITYTVGGHRETVMARQCLMAIPAPLVAQVVGDLPAWKREALTRADFVSSSTAAFLLKVPVEECIGEGLWRIPVVGRTVVSVTNPTFMVPPERRSPTAPGLLRAYCGDRVSRRLRTMASADAAQVFADDLTAMFPALRGNIVESATTHWEHADHPWRVGRADLTPALQAPTGRIHYCGDYTISRGLNAAVASADRAVEELMAT